MPRRHHLAILLLGAVLALGMAKRSKNLVVGFFVEAHGSEGPKFTFSQVIPGTGQTRYFSTAPDITQRDIEWFYPFSAKDGVTQGAAFKLSPTGTRRLENLSTANRGRYILTRIGRDHSSFLIIDQTIRDGIIVVWDGLTPEDVALLEKELELREGAAPRPQ